MKLKTNRIRDNMGSLEEGLVVNEKNNDYGDKKWIGRSENCKSCILFTKVMFYLLLVLSILVIGWVGVMCFTSTSKSLMWIVHNSPRDVDRENFDSGYAEEISSSSTLDNTMTSTQEYDVIPTETSAHDTSSPDYHNTPDGEHIDPIIMPEMVKTGEDLHEDTYDYLPPDETTIGTDRSSVNTEEVMHKKIEFDAMETTTTSIINSSEEMEKLDKMVEELVQEIFQERLFHKPERPDIENLWDSHEDMPLGEPEVTTETNENSPESVTQKRSVQEIDTSTTSIIDQTEESEVPHIEVPWDIVYREIVDLFPEELHKSGLLVETTPEPLIIKPDRWSDYESMEETYDLYDYWRPDEPNTSTELIKAVTESVESVTQKQYDQEIETSATSIIDQTKKSEMPHVQITPEQAYEETMALFPEELRKESLLVKTTPEPLIIETGRWSDHDSKEDTYDLYDYWRPDEPNTSTELIKAVTESVESVTQKQIDQENETSATSIIDQTKKSEVPHVQMTPEQAYEETMALFPEELRKESLLVKTTPEPLIIETGRWSDYVSKEDTSDLYDYWRPDEPIANTELIKTVTESVEPETTLVVKTDVSTDPVGVRKDERVVPDDESQRQPDSERAASDRKFAVWLSGKTMETVSGDDSISSTVSPNLAVINSETVNRKSKCNCTEEPVFPRYRRGRVPFISIMRMRTVCTCDDDYPEVESDSEEDMPRVIDPPEYSWDLETTSLPSNSKRVARDMTSVAESSKLA